MKMLELAEMAKLIFNQRKDYVHLLLTSPPPWPYFDCMQCSSM